FQAEDGIRYRNVTGVQTCALPISIKVATHMVALPIIVNVNEPSSGGEWPSAGQGTDLCGPDCGRLYSHVTFRSFTLSLVSNLFRSEERRVGKEQESRGARA